METYHRGRRQVRLGGGERPFNFVSDVIIMASKFGIAKSVIEAADSLTEAKKCS